MGDRRCKIIVDDREFEGRDGEREWKLEGA